MPTKTYDKQDPRSIRSLFANIAKRYDLGNAILSMRLFRHWNRQLIAQVLEPTQPDVILDLCCGTGDIAYTYLKHAEKLPKTLFMIDFCEEMIQCAKAKKPTVASDIHYIVGDAQDIPLPSNSVDAVTIAYGIRNIADPARAIAEAFRILKPGGHLGILELTRPTNPIIRFGHSIYLKTFVPIVGRLLTSDKQAYDYLQHSIKRFIPATQLEEMMQTAGFANTSVTPLTGGIATIICGTR
ncbi:MAG: bifunctional demethylmenaquinone methyltransferase/2-methoxy-6-polyprenyl-1,4-benzoquinol methylase UbiE [Nitrosomonas sp.]|nr:MAG: bifunctional demethylmenaquinone methyltransferase/2-methoxy-6-polyprenyl-1,4-benzoquinol methylase UbiE [Nitrosomonas sp.]